MTKVITVILQFEQDSAYTVARARFREHFTDVIRLMNGNPNLGKLRSAHVALADTMNSIAPLDATAYGTPRAMLPKTFQKCDTCTNVIACQNRGGCILAQRAVDEAAEKLKRAAGARTGRITITGQSGVREITEDLLPRDPDRKDYGDMFDPSPGKPPTTRQRFDPTPAKRTPKKAPAKKQVPPWKAGKPVKRGKKR